MKRERLFLIFSLIMILLLIFMLDFSKPLISGKISKIIIGEKQITLYLENYSGNIIIQNKTEINLKKNNQISIFGKEENSLNKKIIFVDKIVCLNC